VLLSDKLNLPSTVNYRHLLCDLQSYYLDEPFHYNIGTQENEGLKWRAKWFANGVAVQLTAKLNLDISSCRKLLPPGVALKLTLTYARPQFTCMTAADGISMRYELNNCRLRTTRHLLQPKYASAIVQHLNEGNLIHYNFNRSALTMLAQVKDVTSFTKIMPFSESPLITSPL
jgi:hypothetical protein